MTNDGFFFKFLSISLKFTIQRSVPALFRIPNVVARFPGQLGRKRRYEIVENPSDEDNVVGGQKERDEHGGHASAF